MTTLVERWAPVPGHPDYEVSDSGRVRSMDRMVTDTRGRTWQVNGRVLRARRDHRGTGYPLVNLAGSGTPRGGRTRLVHHLVLEAFVGPKPHGLVARHLNDIPNDNRLSNLAYGTPSQNNLDAVANGRNRNSTKTHCPRGHEYAGSNLIVRSNGRRKCRACSTAPAAGGDSARPGHPNP
jgi:hypothetical protein